MAHIKPKSRPQLLEIDITLDALRDSARVKFESFETAVLPDRLNIGVQCLKAHILWGIQDPKISGAMKGKKRLSIVDTLPNQGFEPWLAERHPWLKRPTAYRWMDAVKGLGLDENATPDDVAAALQARAERLGEVTIKSLCDAACEHLGPPPEPEKTLQQTEFDFICDRLRDFRIQGESIRALKIQLDQNPNLMRVASARAYNILYDLTGTHWQPCSDPASDLALVNPDNIEL